MALQHVPYQFEQRSDTREWRGSAFPSLETLERWLASHGLAAPRHEALPCEAGTYQHAGYKAVVCRVCHQPTIHGVSIRTYQRDGQTWQAHRLDNGTWCRGKTNGHG